MNYYKSAVQCLTVTVTVQEGWLSPTERASVSAISLRHILASRGTPLYGTIAVNIILHGWKEDSMLVKRIAAYTHLS